MSHCGEKAIALLGKLCISYEDSLMIYFNIILGLIIMFMFYIKRMLNNKKNNLSVCIKHNFVLLGEGNLSYFYTPSSTIQKNVNTKKKVQQKAVTQQTNTQERLTNHNEVKCNICGRDIKVTYQFTLPKMNSGM
jgi:hypothetical protein